MARAIGGGEDGGGGHVLVRRGSPQQRLPLDHLDDRRPSLAGSLKPSLQVDDFMAPL
jgi:hypothetical protein